MEEAEEAVAAPEPRLAITRSRSRRHAER